jgi:hypothetical protein
MPTGETDLEREASGQMILSLSQIAQYAAAAGFTGNDLATAVAIAIAESGGNPSDYNKEPQDVPGRYGRTSPSDGKGSYGLWQIYLAAHPEFAVANLLDPQTNANAAFTLYSNHGFSAWSTYNDGTYGMYLPPDNPVAPAPLVLDAATGQPVAPMAMIDPASLAPITQGLSFGSVLLWSALGVFALWLFEEAM